MSIQIPKIDDRTYQQILSESLARVPVHNPEWTNFNQSDPGVTLLQVFAFMTETLLYRANQIPERNRMKFLQLLGIPLQAASSARGMVVFANPRGLPTVRNLPSGLEVLAGKVPFRTRESVDVLPVESAVFYKSALPDERKLEIETLYSQLYPAETGTQWAFYETKQLADPVAGGPLPSLDLADTVDGALWIALLARERDEPDDVRAEIAGKILSLGILPALTASGRTLVPGNRLTTATQPTLIFQRPKLPDGGKLPLDESRRRAQYIPLNVIASSAGDRLSEPGIVQLELPAAEDLKLWDDLEPTEQGSGDFPPSLEDSAMAARVVTWIRIQMGLPSSATPVSDPAELERRLAGQRRARLSWIGVNAASVEQRAHVVAESIGRGTGQPDQVYTLVNKPVIPGSVNLLVNGRQWKELKDDEDLLGAAPEVPVDDLRAAPSITTVGSPTAVGAGTSTVQPGSEVFQLNRESGEIRFGTGLHGARPPAGAILQASYDYGGGRQGNVGIGGISKITPPPGTDLSGIIVQNAVSTWGGDEPETVAEGEQRIPAYLRHRDRLVSQKDSLDVVWRTPGVDLGRVEVLPVFHPDHPDVPADGVVTVMVIPRYDLLHPEAPEPDALFLDAVCQHAEPRRLVTTELHVRGPDYVDVWVSVGLEVVPGAQFSSVRDEVKQALRDFLSPLRGGFDGKGWPLGKTVEALEIWTVATRVPNVAKVEQVLLGGATGEATDRISIQGLELPRLAGLEVQAGEPLSLASLRGDEQTDESPRLVPIPVIPAEC